MSETREHKPKKSNSPVDTELTTRVSVLELKVATLDRQLRSRNTTLACILYVSGGSYKYSKQIHDLVTADFMGARFKTSMAGEEFLIIGQLLKNKQS